MPIQCDISVEPISEASFREIDYEIMSFVFEIHNKMGRMWDEKVYQQELAFRCEEMGFESVLTELPIRLTHRDFVKNYYVDLLVNNAIPYELKVSSNLTGENHAQTLNYLFLLGLQNGKLVNMRGKSVQHRFVSTELLPEDRYAYVLDMSNWCDLDCGSERLREVVVSLLSDWGAFLSNALFLEAAVHFLGGALDVVKQIDVLDGKRKIATQRAHLVSDDVAFQISAVTAEKKWFKRHLERFLQHTNLRALQWINFEHETIVFTTISRG